MARRSSRAGKQVQAARERAVVNTGYVCPPVRLFIDRAQSPALAAVERGILYAGLDARKRKSPRMATPELTARELRHIQRAQ